MKQRKPLKPGDIVYAFGFARYTTGNMYGDMSHTLPRKVSETTENEKFVIISSVGSEGNYYFHRNQVIKVVRKVKVKRERREWWLVKYLDGRTYNFFTKESFAKLAVEQIPDTEMIHVREVRQKK